MCPHATTLCWQLVASQKGVRLFTLCTKVQLAQKAGCAFCVQHSQLANYNMAKRYNRISELPHQQALAVPLPHLAAQTL